MVLPIMHTLSMDVKHIKKGILSAHILYSKVFLCLARLSKMPLSGAPRALPVEDAAERCPVGRHYSTGVECGAYSSGVGRHYRTGVKFRR